KFDRVHPLFRSPIISIGFKTIGAVLLAVMRQPIRTAADNRFGADEFFGTIDLFPDMFWDNSGPANAVEHHRLRLFYSYRHRIRLGCHCVQTTVDIRPGGGMTVVIIK